MFGNAIDVDNTVLLRLNLYTDNVGDSKGIYDSYLTALRLTEPMKHVYFVYLLVT